MSAGHVLGFLYGPALLGVMAVFVWATTAFKISRLDVIAGFGVFFALMILGMVAMLIVSK